MAAALANFVVICACIEMDEDERTDGDGRTDGGGRTGTDGDGQTGTDGDGRTGTDGRTDGDGRRFISYIASRWTIIKDSSSFQSYAAPWDCGFVIPWLFSPSNCYFPF